MILCNFLEHFIVNQLHSIKLINRCFVIVNNDLLVYLVSIALENHLIFYLMLYYFSEKRFLNFQCLSQVIHICLEIQRFIFLHQHHLNICSKGCYLYIAFIAYMRISHIFVCHLFGCGMSWFIILHFHSNVMLQIVSVKKAQKILKRWI